MQNSAKNTALHWAVLNNKMDCVEFLVGEGANVNLKNSEGNTAFDMAVEYGLGEIIVGLLGVSGEED